MLSLKIIVKLVLCFSIVSSILLKSHKQKSIFVKYKKDDINVICSNGNNENELQEQSCIVQICPDTTVMKATYKCFNIDQQQYNEWLQQNPSMLKKGLYHIDLICEKIINNMPNNQNVKNDLKVITAQPEGGIKTFNYNCFIDY